MDHIDPLHRTPATPFVTPRAPGHHEEKRRHDDSSHRSDESGTEEETPDHPEELPRDDGNKGTKIDIQI